MSEMCLWAWRYSVARGWNWTRERYVSPLDATAWLEAFKRDEPGVAFKISKRRPRSLIEKGESEN